MIGIERKGALDMRHRGVEVLGGESLGCGVELTPNLDGDLPGALRGQSLVFRGGNQRLEARRIGIALLQRSQDLECPGEVAPVQGGVRLVQCGARPPLPFLPFRFGAALLCAPAFLFPTARLDLGSQRFARGRDVRVRRTEIFEQTQRRIRIPGLRETVCVVERFLGALILEVAAFRLCRLRLHRLLLDRQRAGVGGIDGERLIRGCGRVLEVTPREPVACAAHGTAADLDPLLLRAPAPAVLPRCAAQGMGRRQPRGSTGAPCWRESAAVVSSPLLQVLPCFFQPRIGLALVEGDLRAIQ